MPPSPPSAPQIHQTVNTRPSDVLTEEEKKIFDFALTPPKMPCKAFYDKNDDKVASVRKIAGDAILTPSRGITVSTGVMGLDLALLGGLNFGSVHELYGFSKSGKSYFIQRLGAMTQAADPTAIVVFFDRENAYDSSGLISQGLDLNRTIVVPPKDIPDPEHLWEMVCKIIDQIDGCDFRDSERIAEETQEMVKDDPTLKESRKKTKEYYGRKPKKLSPHIYMGVDSVPAFAEQKDMIVDQGRRAKAWHSFLRRMTAALDSKLMMVVSNHIIYKPGLYGNPESKTSGTSIDYYRDCGVKCMNLHYLYDENNVAIGNMLGVEIDKNRRGAAAGATFFPVYYNGGANYYSGILPYAMYLGLVKQTNVSTFKDKKNYGRVWPAYAWTDASGKTHRLTEENGDALGEQIKENGLLDAILNKLNTELTFKDGK